MLGTADKMEAELVPAAGFDIEFIPRAAFPCSINRAAFAFPAKFFGGLSKTRRILEDVDAMWSLAWVAMCVPAGVFVCVDAKIPW